MSKPRVLSALAVGLSALLLSGCAEGASPGLGVTVGDETISASRIDTATANVCAAFSDQLEAEGQVVPLRLVKQRVVEVLTLGAQAEQIAEEYGISPSATYEQALAGHVRNASVMAEEVRADYIDFVSAPDLAQDVADQVGRATLQDEGVEEPTVEQVGQAGAEVFASWPEANDVEVNPKYGFEVTDGVLAPTDTSLSFPLSEQARAGSAEELDPAYAGSLPSNQRCG